MSKNDVISRLSILALQSQISFVPVVLEIKAGLVVSRCSYLNSLGYMVQGSSIQLEVDDLFFIEKLSNYCVEVETFYREAMKSRAKEEIRLCNKDEMSVFI